MKIRGTQTMHMDFDVADYNILKAAITLVLQKARLHSGHQIIGGNLFEWEYLTNGKRHRKLVRRATKEDRQALDAVKCLEKAGTV